VLVVLAVFFVSVSGVVSPTTANAADLPGQLAKMISFRDIDPNPIAIGGHGGKIQCGGANTITPTQNMRTVGVSYTCQWRHRDSTDPFANVLPKPPAWTCSDCTGTGFHADVIDCREMDLYNEEVRTKVDGWWVDNNGDRHDMTPIFTSVIFDDCTIVSENITGPLNPKLRALVEAHGSVAGTGPSVGCGGSNSSTEENWPRGSGSYIAVSYVCQKTRPGTTNWTKVPMDPPSYREPLVSGGTGYRDVTISCSDLGSGDWTVRSHVDGWWVDDGVRQEMNTVDSTETVYVSC
jgi:hypothetical protein